MQKVQRNRHKGIQKKQKALGKYIGKESSNHVGRKVNKKKLGKGRRKHVG